MDKNSLEEMGRLLMKYVRDLSIDVCDQTIEESRSNSGTRWAKADFNPAVLIPECVDETLYYLMDAIDQEGIQLSFLSENGKYVDLVEEGAGELSGWYIGTPDGWRDGFSSERFD